MEWGWGYWGLRMDIGDTLRVGQRAGCILFMIGIFRPILDDRLKEKILKP